MRQQKQETWMTPDISGIGPNDIKSQVETALAEDLGAPLPEGLEADLTASLIPVDRSAEATVITREAAVVAGRDWFETTLKRVDPHACVRWYTRDGETVAAGDRLCEITSNARALLTAERTALNFLQTLSAVRHGDPPPRRDRGRHPRPHL